MSIRYLIVLCCLACSGLVCSGYASNIPAQAPCTNVTGDQILGRDLARALPAFAKIPANTPLAPAPLPGGTRVFYLSELQSVAARFSLTIDTPAEACFRYATQPLNPDRVIEAMHAALRIPNATIELLETSTEPAPNGTIVFRREDLGTPASPDQKTPVLWRGDVVYAGNRRFAIWAKARITAPVTRLIATEALRAGVAIKTEQLRAEIVDAFPSVATGSLSAESVAGLLPLRSIAAGAEIRADNLAHPNDVNRGDIVQVEVRFGSARLATTGRAESAGHVGDTIAIRNPESSKVFRARVEGPGKVAVGPGGGVIADSGRHRPEGD